MVVATFVSCLALADPDGIYDAFPGTVHHSVRNFPVPGQRSSAKPGKAVGPQGSPYRNCLGILGRRTGRSGDRGLLGQASTIADRIRADLGQRKNPEQIEKISRSIEPFGS